jgi:hypothetical protein
MLAWLRKLLLTPNPHSDFKVEFEDGSEAIYRVPLNLLRRGDDIVPSLVADQRRAAGLPSVPIKRIVRLPGPEGFVAVGLAE